MEAIHSRPSIAEGLALNLWRVELIHDHHVQTARGGNFGDYMTSSESLCNQLRQTIRRWRAMAYFILEKIDGPYTLQTFLHVKPIAAAHLDSSHYIQLGHATGQWVTYI